MAPVAGTLATTPEAGFCVNDVHCHFLPSVDDGARDLEEAVALLRLAHRDGVRRAVLTPHVFPGRWDNQLSNLRPRFDAFRRFVASEGIAVQLFLGAEVHLLPESMELLDAGELPFIGGWEGKPVLLLELSDGRIPIGALNAVQFLSKRGIVPMIAHPERNRAVMVDPLLIQPFVEAGCLLQLTAASVVGGFGERAARASHWLIDRGWAALVASDAHNLIHRPPMMTAARRYLQAQYGEAAALLLTESSPAKVIDGRQALNLDAANADSTIA